MRCRASRYSRPGVIAPLTGVFGVFLVGMIAIAVDTSWIVLTQSELQNAADSAALAGAQKLVTNYAAYNLPGQSSTNRSTLVTTAVSNARSSARTYAGYNSAGGQASITLLDADIDVGFTDGAGQYTSYSSGGSYPNTVKVVARRDSQANQPLGLFFGPILGLGSTSLTAAATATVYTGTVNSFKSPSANNVGVLPMTYDAQAWKNFVATGQNIDGSSLTDSNGLPVLQVYPSVKSVGNFGQLSLNDSNIGTSTINNWISQGAAPSDVSALLSAGLLPLSGHNVNNWDWQGSTGFTSDMIRNVNNLAGKAFWLPLFLAKDSSDTSYAAGVGTGSGYSFNVTTMVAVQIIASNVGNNDDHRQILLQPATLVDGMAVFDVSTITPAGNSSSYTAMVMAPRLSN